MAKLSQFLIEHSRHEHGQDYATSHNETTAPPVICRMASWSHVLLSASHFGPKDFALTV